MLPKSILQLFTAIVKKQNLFLVCSMSKKIAVIKAVTVTTLHKLLQFAEGESRYVFVLTTSFSKRYAPQKQNTSFNFLIWGVQIFEIS